MEAADNKQSIGIQREADEFRFRYSKDDPLLRGLAFWAVDSVLHCGQNFPTGGYQFIFDEPEPKGQLSLKFLDYFPDV